MNTLPAEPAAPGAQLDEDGPLTTGVAQPAVQLSPFATAALSMAATAEAEPEPEVDSQFIWDGSVQIVRNMAANLDLVTLDMADVRRIGAEGAVVLEAIRRLGYYNRIDLYRITGLRVSQVRWHWARLHHFGYDLPEEDGESRLLQP